MEGESQTVESADQRSQMLGWEDGEPVLLENREVRGRSKEKSIKFRWLN